MSFFGTSLFLHEAELLEEEAKALDANVATATVTRRRTMVFGCLFHDFFVLFCVYDFFLIFVPLLLNQRFPFAWFDLFWAGVDEY